MFGLPLESYSEYYSGVRLPVVNDHIALVFSAISAPTAAFLAPGLYALEADGASCYVVAGYTPVADATCRWIRDGGGMYLIVQAANTVKIAALRAGTDDGTLHINRVG